MTILAAIESGARTLAEVARSTGFTRPTTHRLLKALQRHGLLAPDGDGGYRLGPRLRQLGERALAAPSLAELAHPVLERLSLESGESAQLYVRAGDARLCVDAAESDSELRTIVEVGGSLPITAGSAGKVFMAWAPPDERKRLVSLAEPLTGTTPTGTSLERQLATARRRGWAQSAGEREPGVGSFSAPVLGPADELLAVVSISGPRSRIAPQKAGSYAPMVITAARRIEDALRWLGDELR